MFCKECGLEIDSNAKFCYHCGTNVQQTDTSGEIVAPIKKGFWEKVVEDGKRINAQKAAEKQELKDRVKQMDKDGVAYCPKCYSTSLSAHKKGFGIGKAIIGATVAPIGLIAGNLGAKKVRVTCLKCGHQYWAGKK